MRIVHASHDEYGRYSGGQPGDQTGNEVCIANWYNRPWNMVLRPVHPHVGNTIANVALHLALLPQVGYSQGDRLSLWNECEKIEWDVVRLPTISACNCDCSSLIAVILRFAGIEVPSNVTSYTIEKYVLSGHAFTRITGDILVNPERLRRGDILLNTLHHVAVAVDTGMMVNNIVDYEAVVQVSDYLQVRTSPAIQIDNELEVCGHSQRLINGVHVRICEHAGNWGRIADCNAWVNLNYLRKVT